MSTKPIDFTGCNPVIAENLKKGLATKCQVKNCTEIYVAGYVEGYYMDEGGHLWSSHTVKPILPKKIYVKKASEIMKLLEGNGAVFDPTWNSWSGINQVHFTVGMLRYCGKEVPNEYVWHPDFLEERWPRQ
jgi:hypothetical protein